MLGFKYAFPVIIIELIIFYYLLVELKPVFLKDFDIFYPWFSIAIISLLTLLHEYTRFSTFSVIKKLSETDSLTGAFNRRKFDMDLIISFNQNISTTVLIFDIDHFKKINDKFGHKSGDEVLIKIVDLFKDILRPEDKLYRIGGEEFAIIQTNTTKKNNMNIAQRLMDNLKISTFNNQFKITISIGISTGKLNDPPDTTLSNADKALYLSKKRGRNRVSVK